MILFYTDLQANSYSLFNSPSESGYGQRLDNIIECAEWIAGVIRAKKPKYVIDGGDNFDTIGVVDTAVLSAVSKIVSIIHKAVVDVGAYHITLLGNHDLGYNSASVSSMDFFEEFTEGYLIKTPKVLKLGEYDCLIIPFNEDHKLNNKLLLEHASKGGRLAFTHLDMVGGKFSATKESELGIEVDVTGLTIYNGHHHIYQREGSVFCPGSAIQHLTNQYSPHRGIVYIDSNLKGEWIPNPVSPVLFKTSNIEDLEAIPDNAYVWLEYDPESQKETELLKLLSRFKKFSLTKHPLKFISPSTFQTLKGSSNEELLKSYIDLIYSESDFTIQTLYTNAVKYLSDEFEASFRETNGK